MKIHYSFFKKFSIPVLLFVLASLLFASCKKDEVQVDSEAAGLMVYNLIPDKDAVGFAIDGVNFLPQPVTYTNYSGPYRPVFTGNKMIETYDAQNSSTIAQSPVALKDSGYYSLFAMGANETYRNVFVQDNLASLPSGSGNAFVRFVNGIPDSSDVNVTITSGTDVAVNTESKYAQVSSFSPAAPGNINIVLSNADHSIDVNRTIAIEKDGIYTILLVGLPSAVNPDNNVKILFTQNATIAP